MGMMFASVEETEEFYNQYARMIGFSIRKDGKKMIGKEPHGIGDGYVVLKDT